MANLQAWFYSVDKDRSGSITYNELANLRFANKPLGVAAAKKLIKVFDKNYSGSIGNVFVT
jgi:Ca2+-binding EF-hand superfamily protein